MENLIKPDFGLVFWTVLNFALLVLVLGKFGWKPVLKALEERENRIRADAEAAREARAASEHARAELDERLARLAQETEAAMAKAAAAGAKEKEDLLNAAKKQAEEIAAASKRDLEAQRDRLIDELRAEVAGLSIAAAERIIGREVDKKSAKESVDGFLREVQSLKGGGAG